MAKVIFPLVHYQMPHVKAWLQQRGGKKNPFDHECLGKTSGTCVISKRKQNNDGIRGVHKVALRNSPGTVGVYSFPARLPYIIKAGICICLHSVAS